MEKLLKDLPATLYDEKWEYTLWLCLVATSVGTWQAGYQNIDGEMHQALYAEAKEPLSALRLLKIRVNILEKTHA